jgi:hypothetical protein
MFRISPGKMGSVLLAGMADEDKNHEKHEKDGYR